MKKLVTIIAVLVVGFVGTAWGGRLPSRGVVINGDYVTIYPRIKLMKMAEIQETMNFPNAVQYCKDSTHSGFTNWRLQSGWEAFAIRSLGYELSNYCRKSSRRPVQWVDECYPAMDGGCVPMLLSAEECHDEGYATYMVEADWGTNGNGMGPGTGPGLVRCVRTYKSSDIPK